jgi:hypothetical protein
MQTIHTEQTNRPIFKPTAETEAIIAKLKATPVGGVLTWLDMQSVCPDMDKLRGCLQTARKHLLNEEQAVFAAVRGVGMKRLNPFEVISQESTTHVKVRRAVKSSLRRLSTVDPSTLPQQEGQAHRITSACLGAIALCVKPSSVDKVKQLANGTSTIDGKGVLALFSK